MKNNKIMAVIASTMLALGACAGAMSSLAATYVSPQLEQAQDTAKVMIVYRFRPLENARDEAIAAAQEQLEGEPFQSQEEYLEALSYWESFYFAQIEEDELSAREQTREAIAKQLGISLEDVTYYRDDPVFAPVMVCQLTPEQILEAKADEDIIAAVDFSLGDWLAPKVFEPVQLSDNSGEKLRVTVAFEYVDKGQIYNAAQEKTAALQEILEGELAYNWETILDFYELNCTRDMGERARKETADAGMTALGLTDEDIIERTEMQEIVLYADRTVIGELKACDFVRAVNYYDPDIQITTDPPSEETYQDLPAIPPIEDMASILPGDANEDYLLTLNDAVAVLQYIALPKKYPLKPQGLINADCDGIEGISGGDALWIQKADAGLT